MTGDDFFVKVNPAGPDQAQVVSELRRLKIPFVVIGGVAMGAYARARYTDDVDVVVPVGQASALADHLAALFPGSRVQKHSLRTPSGVGIRGKNYYRIMVGHGKERKEIADVSPADLYPQYGPAHAGARFQSIQGYESFGQVPVPGREEMLALKILASAAQNRKFVAKLSDETDIMNLIPGANLVKVRGLIQGVHGGEEQLARVLSIYRARGEKKNPQADKLFGAPRAQCWICGRSIPLVRGGRFKAHDSNYRRCAGSGVIA